MKHEGNFVVRVPKHPVRNVTRLLHTSHLMGRQVTLVNDHGWLDPGLKSISNEIAGLLCFAIVSPYTKSN